MLLLLLLFPGIPLTSQDFTGVRQGRYAVSGGNRNARSLPARGELVSPPPAVFLPVHSDALSSSYSYSRI